MKCTCGNNISTSDFLGSLDLMQLRYAQEKADSLIAQKTAEEKVSVYRVVEDCGLCYSNHLTFDAAAESLVSVAKELSQKQNIPRELAIVRERIVKSEVRDYCPEYRGA